MKIAYLFFNGQLRGSKKFYSNLIEKQKGDIYCADGGANICYELDFKIIDHDRNTFRELSSEN